MFCFMSETILLLIIANVSLNFFSELGGMQPKPIGWDMEAWCGGGSLGNHVTTPPWSSLWSYDHRLRGMLCTFGLARNMTLAEIIIYNLLFLSATAEQLLHCIPYKIQHAKCQTLISTIPHFTNISVKLEPLDYCSREKILDPDLKNKNDIRF